MNKKSFLNRFLDRLGLRIVRKTELAELIAQIQALQGLASLRAEGDPAAMEGACSPVCVIFSKDRALQLHALLSSLFELASNLSTVYILYKASDERHREAYQEVFRLFQDQVAAVKEDQPFQHSVLSLLASMNSAKVMFLVDDILVIRPFDMLDLGKLPCDRFVPSLRLGRQLSYSYWYQKPMPLPTFVPGIVEDPHKLCWIWEKGVMEWGFPLSLDAHIFSRQEIMIMIKHFEFSGPNSLERILQRFKGIYEKRYGVCPSRSAVVNIPCNRVQAEYDFPHGNVHQDLLLEKWERGLQMDYRKLYGLNNQSVHEEIPMDFVPRVEPGDGNPLADHSPP